MFVANTGTALHADELAKWNEFELTLPVRRSTVIGAKYVTFAALILCGLAISLCTVVCIRASKDTRNIPTAANMLTMPTSGWRKFIPPVAGDKTAAIRHIKQMAANAEMSRASSFFSVPVLKMIGYMRTAPKRDIRMRW